MWPPCEAGILLVISFLSIIVYDVQIAASNGMLPHECNTPHYTHALVCRTRTRRSGVDVGAGQGVRRHHQGLLGARSMDG
jgi:hypothetical protein